MRTYVKIVKNDLRSKNHVRGGGKKKKNKSSYSNQLKA